MMKGRRLRTLFSWMVRATISLPVPDSPRRSTPTSVRATLPMLLNISIHAGELPIRRTLRVPLGETGDGDARRAIEFFASPVILMEGLGMCVSEIQGSNLQI